MIGEMIFDEQAVESTGGTYLTLGLLPIETTFIDRKQTLQVSGRSCTGHEIEGYEIHLGRSVATKPLKPFIQFYDGRTDGVYTEQVFGTYVHGIFQNRSFTRDYFNAIRMQKGIEPISGDVLSDFERREQAYEMLDRHVREHLDMEKIYSFISETTVEKR